MAEIFVILRWFSKIFFGDFRRAKCFANLSKTAYIKEYNLKRKKEAKEHYQTQSKQTKYICWPIENDEDIHSSVIFEVIFSKGFFGDFLKWFFGDFWRALMKNRKGFQRDYLVILKKNI